MTEDHLLAFWFRFIFPNLHFIENEQMAKVMGDLEANINQMTSFVFEEVAREFLLKHVQFDKIGNYWSKDIEIDIMGQKADKWYVGECKWGNRQIGYEAYHQLVQKGSNLPYPVEKYILVSKSGFDKRLFDIEGVILVAFTKEKGFVVLKE